MKIREVIRILEKIEKEYGSEIDVSCYNSKDMEYYNIDNITFDSDFYFSNSVYFEIDTDEEFRI